MMRPQACGLGSRSGISPHPATSPVPTSARTFSSRAWRGNASLLQRGAPIYVRPGRTLGGRARAEDVDGVEILKKENELLRAAMVIADEAAKAGTEALQEAGVDVTALQPEPVALTNGASNGAALASSYKTYEDYWTPQQEPAPGGEFIEEYGIIKPLPEHDGTECLKWDNTLWSHGEHFKYRWNAYKHYIQRIEEAEGGLDSFSKGWLKYGFNRGQHEGKSGIWYREWAPGARALALIGEFNNWQPEAHHWAIKNPFGVWELFLPDNDDGSSAIPHRCKVKARLETAYGEWVERIPAWIKWATQEWNAVLFNGVYYEPPFKGEPGELPPNFETSYTFKYPRPPRPRALRIYECHVGMSSKEPVVNSYLDFRATMLPRIRALGYNAIQIMAVQEHAYYGSFGYHVTNFFAVSSRCGTPDELKAMIDEAHRLGMVVLIDVVHSHASRNVYDGITCFDGTDGMYFHGGARGYHWMWDSSCFNYGTWETMRFLLSNARWWIDEYKFDGYRYDGVTSMMYHHHGLQMVFTGDYEQYFGLSTDVDALVYLMMANKMLHDLFPTVITIGEDVSGMPTFCRPVEEGGIGFDYRLQMAIADKWIEVMKLADEDWNMGNLAHTLTNRRYAENCVGYAESHDQALVGDKTIAFWLMDAEMYDKMSMDSQSTVVDRGISLHKMIRLLTMSLGGESYLNFMGNEFGHPEWIDFPRVDTQDTSTGKFIPGNGGSLEKCRRRWDLAEQVDLKYRFMNDFDRAMQHLDKAFGFIASPHQYISRKDEGDKVIVSERGDLTFVFNFHPYKSYQDYRIGTGEGGPKKIALSSDERVFGGWENVTKNNDVTYTTSEGTFDGRPHSFLAYVPSRTVAVYAPAEWCDAKADEKPLGIPGLGVKDRGPYFAP